MKQQTGSKLGKEYHQGYILLLCLFNLYTEYIVQNTGLGESQAGIKIVKRNNNNFRYTDDSTLMAESEKELMNFLMRVKEESEKAGWKLSIQKMKKMESSLITSWQIDGEAMERVTDFIFLGSKITEMVNAAMKLKDTCSLKGKLWQT